jgi:alkylation response protein AidB-like acyl-CoA dehydrogenase
VVPPDPDIGTSHQGLTSMFHMMNEARIGVGAGAAALGYTGYLKSLEYARTRPKDRPVGHNDPVIDLHSKCAA